MKPLAHGIRVIVQPDDGTEPVAALIRAAEHRLLIKQFTFTHPELLRATIGARARGVAVRVMLNPHRSSGSRANDEALKALVDAGIEAQWTNPKFAVTHEKSLVADDGIALIATFNFAEKYFSATRDYGLVVNDAAAVAEIAAGFAADWDRTEFVAPAESALVWSNLNARLRMAEFISAARDRLDVQHPKFVDAVILDRLTEARARGVAVRLLCGGRHGISTWDLLDTFASLRVADRAGAHVHKQQTLRLHAKLLIADGDRALVGSMNIDRSAFDLRRELGAIVTAPSAVARLRQQFEADWAASHRYHIPDPLQAHEVAETEFPQDAELEHE
jgi:phosphatidylserine/phosphatidylglycerophosphate/cardiolipin synthase-like enzyme